MAGWEVRLHDPARARRVRLFAMLLVLCIPLAFYAGSLWQQQRQPAVQVEPASVAARDEQLLREVEELRQRLVVLSSAEKVSQQANEQSRLSIKLLEEQIYKQQQDLAFYKRRCKADQLDRAQERFAIVQWREVGRSRWTVARLPADVAVVAGEPVYVKVWDCSAALVKREMN